MAARAGSLVAAVLAHSGRLDKEHLGARVGRLSRRVEELKARDGERRGRGERQGAGAVAEPVRTGCPALGQLDRCVQPWFVPDVQSWVSSGIQPCFGPGVQPGVSWIGVPSLGSAPGVQSWLVPGCPALIRGAQPCSGCPGLSIPRCPGPVPLAHPIPAVLSLCHRGDAVPLLAVLRERCAP